MLRSTVPRPPADDWFWTDHDEWLRQRHRAALGTIDRETFLKVLSEMEKNPQNSIFLPLTEEEVDYILAEDDAPTPC